MKQFYTIGVNQAPPTIICHYPTFYRHIVRIKLTGVVLPLPTHGFDGISIVCTKIMPNNNFKQLNTSLSTVGYIEGIDGLKVGNG